MNKKGLTVVELIVSFTLTMTIVIFLTQIIVNLTKVYNNNDKKTELLNKQALISDNINENFIDKQLNGITRCGENCYTFNYLNGEENDLLKIEDDVLVFSELAIPLEDATYGDIKLDVIYTPTLQEYANNSILILTIPINSDIDYNFNVKIVYQFNSSNSNIDEYFTLDENSYIVLKGDTQQTFNTQTEYVEQGYAVYDRYGNEMDISVEVQNPLISVPYKAGTYKIIYNLKDASGSLINQAIRDITITPSTYSITNMIVNGSFENGFTGWNSNLWSKGGVTLSTAYKTSGTNSIFVNAIGDDWEKAAGYTNNSITLEENHVYYLSIDSYLESYTTSSHNILFYMDSGVGVGFNATLLQQWQRNSNVFNVSTTKEYSDIRVGQVFTGTNIYEAYVDSIILIDLTESFGAGNEPSEKWCDENINWFDGTTSIDY